MSRTFFDQVAAHRTLGELDAAGLVALLDRAERLP
jgi:hypothetical protein